MHLLHVVNFNARSLQNFLKLFSCLEKSLAIKFLFVVCEENFHIEIYFLVFQPSSKRNFSLIINISWDIDFFQYFFSLLPFTSLEGENIKFTAKRVMMFVSSTEKCANCVCNTLGNTCSPKNRSRSKNVLYSALCFLINIHPCSEEA